MDYKLTDDEVTAIRAARIVDRENRWDKFFDRYEIPGDIDDVVDWDDEGDDDDGAVPDDENIDADNDIEKEKENMDGLGGVSQLCIDVSSDDEQQKEFFDVFHKCAQQRIESVQEVYQKHWSQDKVSEDGLERTSTKESIVKQANLLTINTPRRSLAPKALSFALRGANKNVGLELVKPVQNFDANNRVSGVVSKIDEAIINSPILQKDGGQYIEQKITTTTTTTTTWTRIRTGMDEIQDLGPIDVDDDDMDVPSPSKKSKTAQSAFSTPKSSLRSRRTIHEVNSETQNSTTKSSTPSKRLSYVQFEVANTTPKPLKGSKHSARLAIMNTPIHVSGKEIQKSVKEKCPTADTDCLNRSDITIARPGESVVVECPTESPSIEKKGDFLFRMKQKMTPVIAKQIDTSF